jgi:glycosyltransferase involved in cell wall biosynthesis
MQAPVSVVIPFHNAVAHFDAALASVEGQTAPAAEIIVVDDGSDAAARRYLQAFGDRVTLITLAKNRGPAVARNVGVEASSQPYIAFQDADDLWEPHKLATQYELMAAWPDLDATHANVLFCFRDGRKVTKHNTGGPLTIEAALARHTMITPTIMMRRKSFDAIEGFDPKFRNTQDWDLQIRLALAGCRIHYIDKVLAHVRREGHGNHSWNWSGYLAGHFRILWKHRRTYIERFGYRHWIRRYVQECGRASVRTSGWKRKLLELPTRSRKLNP